MRTKPPGSSGDCRMSLTPVVIVGAGHAGVQAAVSLREEGFDGGIVLLSAEKDAPYQRPPLSKAFLKGEMEIHGLPLRAEAHFRERRIDLRLGVSATRIDRASRKVELSDGGTIAYGHLILATGARQRRLDAPGIDLEGVFALRDIADATQIRERLQAKPRAVIVGAGFIGLEIAATALSLGAEATVVEIARPMGRAVSPFMSDFFLKEHGAFGARFKLGVGVAAITGREKAETVVLTDGESLSADMVVVGIGVVAEDALARACGLECLNGIVVDEFLKTSDPAISAIGDCADFPNAWLGFRTRLESVQNAVDQGRAVAARLTGKPKALQGSGLVLERSGRPEADDRGPRAWRRCVGRARRPGDAGVLDLRLPRRQTRGRRIGQSRRRPRGRQADHRRGEGADAGGGGRSGLRPQGAGEAVGDRLSTSTAAQGVRVLEQNHAAGDRL